MHCRCNTVQDYIRPVKYIKKTGLFSIEEVTVRECRFCGRDATPDFKNLNELIIQRNNGGSIKCANGYSRKTFDFKTYEAMEGIDFEELYYMFEDKCYETFDEEDVEDIVHSVFDLGGTGNTSLIVTAHKSIEIIYQLMAEFDSLSTGQCPVGSVIRELKERYPLELDIIEDTNEPIKTRYHTPTGFILKFRGAIFKKRYKIPFSEIIVNIWFQTANLLLGYNKRKEAKRAKIRRDNFEAIKACRGSVSRQTIRKNLRDRRSIGPKPNTIREQEPKVILRKNERLRKQRRKKNLKE